LHLGWLETLGVDGGLEGGRALLEFVVEPELDGKFVEIVVEAPARRERNRFLREARDMVASVGGNWNAIESDAEIIAHHLQATVLAPVEPRQNGVAGEEVRPTFEGCRKLDSDFFGLIEDGQSWLDQIRSAPLVIFTTTLSGETLKVHAGAIPVSASRIA